MLLLKSVQARSEPCLIDIDALGTSTTGELVQNPTQRPHNSRLNEVWCTCSAAGL